MTTPSIRLRRADAPALGPGVQLRVSHTLLPLYWLRGVPVLRDVSHELTIFERFILEMALELGSVSGEDVTEVLDLRPEFLARGAWRLVVAGALRLDGDIYRVVPNAARKLRQTRVLPQRVQSTADFVLLPRTGDLLAVASGRSGGWLAEADRQRRKLRPRGPAPAPETLWSRKRAEYLAERVRTGDIAGSDREIAEVVLPADEDKALLPRLRKPRGKTEPEDNDDIPARGCPAYNCSAEVKEGTHGLLVEVCLTAEPSRGKDQDGADPGGDQFSLKAELTGAANLVATWRAQLDELDVRAAWQQVTQAPCGFERVERTSVSTWVFHVGGLAAQAIAVGGQSLAEPAVLELEAESHETIIEAHLVLLAADEVAEALFARDLLVASLLAAPDPRAVLAAAAVDEKPLRERIWQLGHFGLAYTLREPEDFGYE
jgi:hypothetical protein